ncbi:MAG: ribonuclease P protein component [Bacteroidales bacterium]|jgi:ribonuclease P protein component|nr:ribonuclease P protein component [Bacteroidales bacterium]
MNQFPKKEKLCSQKEISSLFSEGKRFLVYPFSVSYRLIPYSINPIIKVLIISGKKYHKRAVARNRIKRLIREAYRLNKTEISNFCAENKYELHISISYIDKKTPDFKTVNSNINIILDRLITNLNNSNNK